MIKFPAPVLHTPLAEEALRIVRQLHEADFEAVWAGGCVRDALLGRAPKDFDVATNATPDAVRQVFGRKRTLAFGASFGVIGVLPPKSHSNQLPTEVATFRADGDYTDGRRPDSVTFGDMRADALRRDFTINGMFYDPVADVIHDFVGGEADLAAKQLRTIGMADHRFDEDKLRMLRAVRFATVLEFELASETLDAIRQHAATIKLVSGERIGAEMRRVLTSPNAFEGLQRLVHTDLAEFVWPATAALVNDAIGPNTQSYLHRLGPRTFAASMAVTLLGLHSSAQDALADLRQLTKTWKLSGEEVRQVTAAINYHKEILDCESVPWSRLQPLLVDRDIATTIATASAMTGPSAGVDRATAELARSPEQLDPPMLISGDDLISAGYSPGPHFRSWLSELRRMQLDAEITDSDEGFELVKKWSKQGDPDPA